MTKNEFMEKLAKELKARGILIRHFEKPRIRAYNRITVGMIKATGKRHLVAVIAAQKIGLHMLVLRCQFCQNQRTGVTRTIIDKYNIVIIGFLLHNSGSMLVKFVQVIFFIKYRHY